MKVVLVLSLRMKFLCATNNIASSTSLCMVLFTTYYNAPVNEILICDLKQKNLLNKFFCGVVYNAVQSGSNLSMGPER